MNTIENWIEQKLIILKKDAPGHTYVPEVIIKKNQDGTWFGYIWMFDGRDGNRYCLVRQQETVLDVIVEMERKCEADKPAL